MQRTQLTETWNDGNVEPQNKKINAQKITTVKMQFMQSRLESLKKKKACWDSNPDLCNTGAVSNQRAHNPNGSWSLNWSEIDPGQIQDEITNKLAFFLANVYVVSLIGVIFFAFHFITF